MEDWAGIQSSSIMERILLCVCCFSGWLVSTCCPRQYHYVADAKTWTEAQSYCQQIQTDLASIENTEEMKQLNSTVSSAAHSSELWIGLYSQIRWRWSDGLTGSGADYRNWDTSEYEPDFYSGVQFCVSSLEGKWWDFQCSEKLQFICYRGSQMNPEFDLVDKEMSWSDARRYCRRTSWTWPLSRTPERTNKSMKRLRLTSAELNYFPEGMDTVKRQVVKLTVHVEDPPVDLNDSAVKAELLTRVKEQLKKKGVGGVSVRWRVQPYGKLLAGDGRRKKTLREKEKCFKSFSA
ncbi:uncharacterized protein LOC120434844 [Oreochromis aureus]|uniref:uncharacterized protein LOC120434844 n=1 Tax=Oreochromis aureus TaxID=47969 RepID=UPI0019541E5A|nr:uncharacterized protein LOC120434844 [Oreochromis aureus]